jgi:hypothetical protein
MSVRGLAVLATLLHLAVAPMAHAEPGLDATRTAALAKAAGTVTAALLAKDGAAMFDLLPPALTAAMAAATGNSLPAFRAMFIDNIASNRPGTEVFAHRLDLDGMEVFAGDDGRTYALLPTRMQAADPWRGRFRLEGTTVAVPEGDAWHFFTIADANGLAMILSAYPALAGAGLTAAVLTPEP